MNNMRVLVSLFIVILINPEHLFLTEVLCDAIQLVRQVINYYFGVLFLFENFRATCRDFEFWLSFYIQIM